jgi:hypothetical protein
MRIPVNKERNLKYQRKTVPKDDINMLDIILIEWLLFNTNFSSISALS